MMRLVLLFLIMCLGCGSKSEPKTQVVFNDRDVPLLLKLTNEDRKKRSLPPLVLNDKLTQAARSHAKNMVIKNKLSHSLDGKSSSDRITDAGYKWRWCGENIAWNQRSMEEVQTGWMNSTGHRANILNVNAKEIGIAIAYSEETKEPYYCTVFAKPQ